MYQKKQKHPEKCQVSKSEETKYERGPTINLKIVLFLVQFIY